MGEVIWRHYFLESRRISLSVALVGLHSQSHNTGRVLSAGTPEDFGEGGVKVPYENHSGEFAVHACHVGLLLALAPVAVDFTLLHLVGVVDATSLDASNYNTSSDCYTTIEDFLKPVAYRRWS